MLLNLKKKATGKKSIRSYHSSTQNHATEESDVCCGSTNSRKRLFSRLLDVWVVMVTRLFTEEIHSKLTLLQCSNVQLYILRSFQVLMVIKLNFLSCSRLVIVISLNRNFEASLAWYCIRERSSFLRGKEKEVCPDGQLAWTAWNLYSQIARLTLGDIK